MAVETEVAAPLDKVIDHITKKRVKATREAAKSRFDRYMRNAKNAKTPDEKRRYEQLALLTARMTEESIKQLEKASKDAIAAFKKQKTVGRSR
jgi:hypothetical protein